MTTIKVPVADVRTIRFEYVNWRGDQHTYVVEVESFELGPYHPGGLQTHAMPEDWVWVMHADVLTRDGDARREMGPNRQRTFILDKVKAIA